jgi:hypothetical protein
MGTSRFTTTTRAAFAAALAAIVLRVLVPAGYMSAPLAGDWFLVLCPDDLPAAVATLLTGADDHHHHHHDPADADGKPAFGQCELGAGLAVAVAVAASAALEAPTSPDPEHAQSPRAALAFLTHAPYHSRAPPARSRT